MPLAGTGAAAQQNNGSDLIAHLVNSLCTRTLNHFAQEAKLDGESLQDAVSRYEIDYAWHVLGSARLRDECLSSLEGKLGRALSSAQRAQVADVLQQAALGLAPELLMSFDNDVPEALANGLLPLWGAQESLAQHSSETAEEALG
ncbi:MAG: hypothetical protein C0423_12535 [Methylibium sp.]|nr:hypothetical protein [Methylibium sp.]